MQNISSFSILISGPWRARFQLLGVWICGTGVVLSSVWLIVQIVLIQLNPVYAPPAKVVAEAPPAEPYFYAFDLKEMTFPIFSKTRNRVLYGRFSLSLDCKSPESRSELEKGRARVVDSVLSVAADYYYEDFSDSVGFDRFKRDLLTSLNQRFPGNGPRRLSLSDWTIG